MNWTQSRSASRKRHDLCMGMSEKAHMRPHLGFWGGCSIPALPPLGSLAGWPETTRDGEGSRLTDKLLPTTNAPLSNGPEPSLPNLGMSPAMLWCFGSSLRPPPPDVPRSSKESPKCLGVYTSCAAICSSSGHHTPDVIPPDPVFFSALLTPPVTLRFWLSGSRALLYGVEEVDSPPSPTSSPLNSGAGEGIRRLGVVALYMPAMDEFWLSSCAEIKCITRGVKARGTQTQKRLGVWGTLTRSERNIPSQPSPRALRPLPWQACALHRQQ